MEGLLTTLILVITCSWMPCSSPVISDRIFYLTRTEKVHLQKNIIFEFEKLKNLSKMTLLILLDLDSWPNKSSIIVLRGKEYNHSELMFDHFYFFQIQNATMKKNNNDV